MKHMARLFLHTHLFFPGSYQAPHCLLQYPNGAAANEERNWGVGEVWWPHKLAGLVI